MGATILALVEIQGHPEGMFVGETATDVAHKVFLWSRKVREAGFLPEVHWMSTDPDKTFEDYS